MSVISIAATWSPPPTCLAGNAIWQIYQNCANGALCWYFQLGAPITSNCLLPSYNPTSYYSPGQCPHGYTSACGSTQTVSSDNTQVTETAYTCYPSEVQSTKSNDHYKLTGTALGHISAQRHLIPFFHGSRQ
jgi:hypothetical protein